MRKGVRCNCLKPSYLSAACAYVCVAYKKSNHPCVNETGWVPERVRGGSGCSGCSERVGWQPLWSARRIHLHLCFVPTNFELLSAATKQNQRQRQAPAWQDMLLPVCLPACHAATLHVLAGGVQVHFAATTARTKRADASFILALLGAVSHMHTICILISLEWFRQQKTPTNSQSVSQRSLPLLFSPQPASLPHLPAFSSCQHVSQSSSSSPPSAFLRCFYLSACLSLRPSVHLTVCLYFYPLR